MELQMEPLLAGVTGTGVEAAREYAGRLPTLPASAWDAVAAEVELAAALQSATAEAVPFTGEEGPWRFQAALGLVTAVAYRDRLSAAGLAEAGKLFEGIVEPLTAGSPTA
jgi:hypothetical protein